MYIYTTSPFEKNKLLSRAVKNFQTNDSEATEMDIVSASTSIDRQQGHHGSGGNSEIGNSAM